jgi:hypothetical protein
MTDFVPRRVLDRAFRRLNRQALLDRLHALRALATVRGVQYLDDTGRARTIDIALKPWVLTTRQLLYFHHVIQQLSDALTRLPALYAQHASVRRVLQFDDARESWLALAPVRRVRPLAVMGRLDSTASYDDAGWSTRFRMLEPNAVGVGGVHYAPAGCGIVLDAISDVLARALPGRVISPTPDPRQLLIDELASVGRRLGRPLRAIALIENAEFTTGTDEFGQLARYLTGQGLKARVVDPRQLHLRRGRVCAGDTPIDLVYRDCELNEFIEMEAGGSRLTALRQAIRDGRLISGLQWEFDQKSAWEIFTDVQYASGFTPSQRRLFRQHLLWTRLVREDRVTDWQGRLVDLPQCIRRNRQRLVLKPNTMFGGEGVVLGRTVSQQAWEKELHRALHGRRRYVVQTLADIASDAFPLLHDGHVQHRTHHTVSGFFFTSTGVGLVGRFSSRPVVNVSQGGGLIPALWVH